MTTTESTARSADPHSQSAEEDIVTALKETLERTGTLDTVRGILRADIYHCINDSMKEKEEHSSSTEPALEPPRENVLINELIADYLAFNGYFNTLSVLAAESGNPNLVEVNNGGGFSHENDTAIILLGSDFIRAELGLSKGSTTNLTGRRNNPLAMLYEIVETLKAGTRFRATSGS